MADDKKTSGDDGFIRTESGVREAFDNAKGGISAGTIGGIVSVSTLGLVLVLSLFVITSINNSGGSPDERQENVIRAAVMSIALFALVLIFIGIVFLVT